MISAPVVKWPRSLVLRSASAWCLCVFAVSLVLLTSACGSKLPKLREQLNDPDPDQKIAAIEALAEAKDTVSVPRIAELLQDSVPDVRKAAAARLGIIGDTRACQPLADLFDSEQQEYIQGAAIRALVHLGPIQSSRSSVCCVLPVPKSGRARLTHSAS